MSKEDGELLLVWRIIADGGGDYNIARVIQVTEIGARVLRTKLYSRLGVDGVADCTRLAVRHGVIKHFQE